MIRAANAELGRKGSVARNSYLFIWKGLRIYKYSCIKNLRMELSINPLCKDQGGMLYDIEEKFSTYLYPSVRQD